MQSVEPVRPIPIRPHQRSKRDDSHALPDHLKQSKSTADLSSLSRTSSFLSFTGLENLKSSALFGIFEKGGYETSPPTPDIGSRHYDFHLDNPEAPEDPHLAQRRLLTAGMKLGGIGLAAFSFITLFNQLPNTNKVSALPSTRGTNPIFYAMLAMAVTLTFSFLDRAFSQQIPTQKTISEPMQNPKSTANLVSNHESGRSDQVDKPWSYNLLVRYFAGLLGLGYAGSKLDFTQSYQFNICVATITLCAIGVLDRTFRGLVVGLGVSGILTGAYACFSQVAREDLLSVALLVWLNVTLYGSLGKHIRLLPKA